MTSQARPRIRPSRASSAGTRASISTIEESVQNGSAAAAASQHRFTEEIEEIRRYEDFTTIDWVQDAAREQIRRSARNRQNLELNRRKGWKIRQKMWELYDAGQAWIVVTLVGAAIGLNAAILNIVTEWLSDVKLGYCETAFYLNKNFCCWGADNPEDGVSNTRSV